MQKVWGGTVQRSHEVQRSSAIQKNGIVQKSGTAQWYTTTKAHGIKTAAYNQTKKKNNI